MHRKARVRFLKWTRCRGPKCLKLSSWTLCPLVPLGPAIPDLRYLRVWNNWIPLLVKQPEYRHRDKHQLEEFQGWLIAKLATQSVHASAHMAWKWFPCDQQAIGHRRLTQKLHRHIKAESKCPFLDCGFLHMSPSHSLLFCTHCVCFVLRPVIPKKTWPSPIEIPFCPPTGAPQCPTPPISHWAISSPPARSRLASA